MTLRRLLLTLTGCALVSGALPGRAADEPAEGAALPPVRTCAALRQLSPEELEEHRPAVLEGVITHFPVDSVADFWLQDATAGLYIFAIRAEMPSDRYPPGTRVRVTGTTSARTFAPGLVAERVEVLGRGPLPDPLPVSLDELIAGNREGEFVELTAVIRSVGPGMSQRQPQWELRLARDRGRVTVVVPANGRPAAPVELIDAAVRIRGVMNAFRNTDNQTFTRLLRVTSMDDITVAEPAPADPFAQPLVSLYELSRFVPRGLTQHRVRVRGTVTLCRPGERCFLEQDGHGLQVIDSTMPDWRPGDQVEVVGFPALGNSTPFLENALFSRIGRGQPPVPEEMSTADLAGKYVPSRLVRTSAELTGILRNPDSVSLLLQEQNVLVRADVPVADATQLPEEWSPGSRMTVTGVWIEPDGEAALSGAGGGRRPVQQLLLRDLSDVSLAVPAPWWTERRLRNLALATITALALVFAWAGLLRRQVRRRTEQLTAEIRARLGERAAWEAVRTERQRLAADLHDGIEQLLTTATWQVDGASDSPSQAAAAPRLRLARRLLTRCREEVRRSVWDLRAESLDRGDLVSAIREAARPLASRHGIPVEVESGGDIPPLPPLHASCLLRLTQEAISNALRHAGPDKVTVTLRGEPGRVSLTIHDDGCGFDPAAHPGVEDGHFGLTGMQERATRIGAQLDITSEPGHGTTIRVLSPLDPPAHNPALAPEPDYFPDPAS